MTLLDGVTLSIAVLGAVLGLLNTWHSVDQTRVKVRVRPKHAVPVGGINPKFTFCIEVTNLSTFAVTINETGVFYEGTEERGAYLPPVLIDGGGWPRRLEPRSSVTIFGEPPVAKKGHPLKCGYAMTACGVVVTGTSPAFKQLISRSN